MLGNVTVHQLDGATVYDSSDKKIGKISNVYLADDTGEPEFVTVATGMFGSKETFVPIGNATASGDKILVPYDKDTINAAPSTWTPTRRKTCTPTTGWPHTAPGMPRPLPPPVRPPSTGTMR
jgi:sporulation protein YlmC with PRC-barrel domain